ncbi:beta-N-acetylhexosaminidase [Flavobacterium rhamnosiphilum]|uniref:beta-N-acetylhexosaminidase n=1 Tax=Flavobacterium rhamnosiphilum TaxID=2541724 RepID=A0A4R5FBL9_9FLAO|nr:family 20 glycosylhydrolase [Flavobacterium rhamnosiphilum]TDE45969.1 beta-N-acetylhexosaminidase [Flavobacterium rhamnosiphilum]
MNSIIKQTVTALRSSVLLFLLLAPMLVNAQQQPSIIPKPVDLKMGNGNFTIDGNTTIQYKKSQKELKATADFLASYIKNISGFSLKSNKAAAKKVEFVIEKSIQDEGYQLTVSPTAIVIKASSPKGVFYGIQSILQTLPAIRTNAALEVPVMQVNDYPRFKWRGMHLDVSRHFFGPDMIKEYIDLMASYKINVFHWHLVDDQGWRIEIKKYPKLTEIGAWRVDNTNLNWRERPQAKEGEKPTYGGFYTQEQIKEIVKYAAERNITIVPEIEMPGHVASAIASYPQLSCTQQPQLPLTGGNYTNMSSNYCAGNEEVFSFLQDVLSEVLILFPSTYIHLGGDEVDKAPWKKCPRCQERMKAEGLKNEDELQSYFMKRMEKFILSNNRKMIGWDEILEGGLAPEAAVMSWRGEAGGIEAAKMKHNVVMTPGSPCYFDHYQAGPEGEPFAIGGFNTVKKVYDYEPIPKELNEEEGKYVLGAQGNVWTEFITTTEHLEYMVLPRMAALAEVLWSPKENKNWDGFNERLQYHFKGYAQKGLHYSPGNFTVNIKPSSQNGQLMVSFYTEALNGQIRYTTDGTEPTIQSEKYEKPIAIKSSLVLKASTVVDGQIKGLQAAKQNFVMHKAVGSTVKYTNPVSQYYLADGPNSLTDGVRGTNAVGKYWHGFSGKDMIATVDLDETKPIKTISLGCLQNYSDWIFLPQSVKFEVSTDGTVFTEIKTINNPIDTNQKTVLYDFSAAFAQQSVRYIRVTAKNNLCPPGHSGAGKPGWLFVDEIIVE